MPKDEPKTVSPESRFYEIYGSDPVLFRAPGRVNLIGEHTDYNDGFVMPVAIGFYTWIAAAKRQDRVIEAYSSRFGEKISFSLDKLDGPPSRHWSDFIRGMAAVLLTAGHHISGANLVIDGDIPLGAGLSSSASLEMATALALTSISDLDVDRLELVKLSQKTEHEYVGTLCGIMDQFISAFGVAGHGLVLDCRSLEYQLLPIPSSLRLVVCNSMVKHEHASGEYNQRRADCEAGVKLLQPYFPGMRALRDIGTADLETRKSSLPLAVYRRCRHVVTENERILAASQALQAGNPEYFGTLMYRSHESLRDNYEMSCKELNLLVDLASSRPGVYGARMTGGGFGGCTINLTTADAAFPLKEYLERAYHGVTGMDPEVYICEPAQGAGVWNPERNYGV
jgi:galactokinase